MRIQSWVRKGVIAFLSLLALPVLIAATLLPPGESTFLDANGNPLSSGTVTFYVPGTTTPKNTWQDAAGTILNTNPVVLNAAGRAIIYGSGEYREIVKDSAGNTIWDQLTADTAPTTGISWGGTSGGSANAQTVVASGFSKTAGSKLLFIAGHTNTGALTVNPNGDGAIDVLKPSPSGPINLSGGEVVSGTLVELDYDGNSFNILTDAGSLLGPSTDLASAATTNLCTIPSHTVNITGTVTITSFGTTGCNTDYPIYNIVFADTLTLTYDATALILPGTGTITTQAGDAAMALYLGSGHWKVLQYTRLRPETSVPPQGRLTFTTAVPVMTSDVTTATTVYFTPYQGNAMPYYNGIGWTVSRFTELSMALNASAQLADTNYDLFVASDSGTARLCSGPAWSSATARGTGAGTTQLSTAAGFLTNAVSMTCKYGASSFTVAANYGLYVGTMRTTGTNGQSAWTANPAAASGGGNARLYLWNMYNRVGVSATSEDSTDSWNYTTATWRSANNSASNRVSMVVGVAEDSVVSQYSVSAANSGTDVRAYSGIGLDSTSAISGLSAVAIIGVATDPPGTTITSRYVGIPGLGLHYCQALEYSLAVGTTTWYGDAGTGLIQMGLTLSTRM